MTRSTQDSGRIQPDAEGYRILVRWIRATRANARKKRQAAIKKRRQQKAEKAS